MTWHILILLAFFFGQTVFMLLVVIVPQVLIIFMSHYITNMFSSSESDIMISLHQEIKLLWNFCLCLQIGMYSIATEDS